MKKIILLFLILIPVNTYASVYYTDYEKYLTETEEVLEETDLLKKEEVKFYNTYKIKKTYYGYEAKDHCRNYDIDDYQEGMIRRSYTTNTMESKYTQTVNAFSGVSIYKFFLRPKSLDINIKEIKIFNNGNKINYNASVSSKDTSSINDNNLNTSFNLTTKDSLYLYLDQNYSVYDIELQIITDDPIDLETRVSMNLTNSSQATYIYRLVSNYLTFETKDNYQAIKEEFGLLNNDTANPHYRLIGKYYHCYDEEKIVLNKYQKDGDSIILDDYYMKYNYYKRDFIEIDDNQDIDINTDLSTIITNTSLDKSLINIDNNINYEEDGEYIVKFKVGNLEIEKKVFYSKPKVEILEYKEELNDNVIKEVLDMVDNNVVNEESESIVVDTLPKTSDIISKAINEDKEESSIETVSLNDNKKKIKKNNNDDDDEVREDNIVKQDIDKIYKVTPLKQEVIKDDKVDYRLLIWSIILLIIMTVLLLYRLFSR